MNPYEESPEVLRAELAHKRRKKRWRVGAFFEAMWQLFIILLVVAFLASMLTTAWSLP